MEVKAEAGVSVQVASLLLLDGKLQMAQLLLANLGLSFGDLVFTGLQVSEQQVSSLGTSGCYRVSQQKKTHTHKNRMKTKVPTLAHTQEKNQNQGADSVYSIMTTLAAGFSLCADSSWACLAVVGEKCPPGPMSTQEPSQNPLTQAGWSPYRFAAQGRQFGRPRQADYLRSGVQDQPDHHGETLSSLKMQKIIQVLWHMPIIPATWEAEAGESLEPGRRKLHDLCDLGWSAMEQPWVTATSMFWAQNLKYNNNNNNNNNNKLILGGWAQCLMLAIPASWEAKAGRSLEVRSSKPVWPTWQNPVIPKNTKISQVWCFMPVITATWEAEVQESFESR
ncbi:putative uncharacterized protein C8orf44, partial [Plecturocebus cupreus]